MTAFSGLSSEAGELIAGRLGLDFSEKRQADLERGLARALEASRFRDARQYLSWLATAPEEDPGLRRLAAHLTVGETYFFRDRACFEALGQSVLPALIAWRRAEGNLRLRLWSAGCATGEEPYSLAILLDSLLPDRSRWSVTLLATDINTAALEAAQKGLYREWSFRETAPELRKRYFRDRGSGSFELDEEIRRMVAFAPLNLAADGYPDVVTNTTAMDVVLCRNVLMYFTLKAQRTAIARLQQALVNGGWLVPSPVDAAAEAFKPLVAVNFTGTVAYSKAPALEPWPPPAPQQEQQGDRVPALDAASMTLASEAAETGLPPAFSESAPEEAPAPSAEPGALEQARALAGQGRLDEAERLCEAAVEEDRLDPQPQLLLAAIRQERGEIPAALKALRRALYLAPDAAVAHFLLGGLLLRQAQRARGRRCMENVVALLASVPRDEPVPGSDGLTAGRLLETARAYLESTA